MHYRSAALTSITLVAALALAVPPLASQGATPAHAAALLAAVDLDGDGSAADDCAPLDPSVHPGALDRPDAGSADTNCDGIDGDAARAVFVSPTGSDAGTGTRANPYLTIQQAITTAAGADPVKDVYAAGGTYAGGATLADGVGIFGGYAPGTWARSTDETTTITGSPAVLGLGRTGVLLQRLTLVGSADGSGNSYAVRLARGATSGSRVAFEDVTVQSAPGAAGGVAAAGASGIAGFGSFGGGGGLGGCGSGVLGLFGNPGSGTAFPPPGTVGAPGVVGLPDAAVWPRGFAANGGSGTAGGGGQGGRGGTGSVNILTNVCGGLGGTGGRGGGAGLGGDGGRAGGGSFGIYSFDSSVVLVRTTVSAGAGGAGGTGGQGGPGGVGVAGSGGLPGECVTIFVQVCGSPGSAGSPGSFGSAGGSGGGGVGGPSAAVYLGGAESGLAQDAASVLTPAAGGTGGRPSGGGTAAPSGASQSVLRTSIAPATSTADFDGDGVADPADACPTTSGGSDLDGDGCPEAPVTSITSPSGGYVLARSARVTFTSNEPGSTFACSIDGGAAPPCTSPRTFSGLTSKTHRVKVWATDAGGAADPSAAQATMTVPVGATAMAKSAGWKSVASSSSFLGSYLMASKRGASLAASAGGVRRIALVATTAPGQGKVTVFLGSTALKTVSLASSATRHKVLLPIASFTSGRSGKVRIVVATSNKTVRIEGIGLATG